jgi:hypothetical protein
MKADANDAYFIASFLDPRYKARWLYLHIDLETAKNIEKQMMIKIKQIYTSDRTIPLGESAREKQKATGVSSLLKRVYGIDSVPKDQSEVDLYFLDPNVPGYEGFNLLNWWREHKSRYPIMSKVARDYLGIAVTSTSVE